MGMYGIDNTILVILLDNRRSKKKARVEAEPGC